MNSRTSALLFLLSLSATIWAQQVKPVPLTTYDDPADGITFKYPTVWKRVSEKGGYCPSMAVGADMYGPLVPVTVAVQFTGKSNFYDHTSLQSLTFQFGTLKGLTDEQCDAIPKQFPQSETKPNNALPTDNHGWTVGRGGECGLNNDIDAQVLTSTIGDRCYVIEADFDYLGGAPVGSRDLTEAEHKALQRHLDDIVRSVQIRSIMLPKSWATTTLHDTVTGVSFAYPEALTPVRDVTDYFSPEITQMRGLTWRAKLAYRPKVPRQIEEASTDLGELTFLYATKAMSSATTCLQLPNETIGVGSGDAAPTMITIHGVEFATAEVSDAGLSHFVSGQLYATYRHGTCHIFEQDVVGLDGYAGDVTGAQWKEINAHMNEIAQTIRFDAPAKP